jgi:hypothetical protein
MWQSMIEQLHTRNAMPAASFPPIKRTGLSPHYFAAPDA